MGQPQPRTQWSFSQDSEHFKYAIKVFPNRENIFQNKLQNKWMAILNTLAVLRLEI